MKKQILLLTLILSLPTLITPAQQGPQEPRWLKAFSKVMPKSQQALKTICWGLIGASLLASKKMTQTKTWGIYDAASVGFTGLAWGLLYYIIKRQTVLNDQLISALFHRKPIHEVKLILQCGADVHCYTIGNQRTPLMVAIRYGNSADIIALLLSYKLDVNAKDAFKKTALNDAFDCDNYTAAHMLLNAGAQLSDELLPSACARNNIPFVRLFLQHGADLKKTDARGRTPFIAAAAQGTPELFNVLIEHGALTTINMRDEHGNTAAMIAAWDNNTIFLQSLIAHGADINCQNYQGKTALMGAVSCEFPEIVKLLLNNGADTEIRDRNGKTVTDYATDDEILTIITDFRNQHVHRAARFGLTQGEQKKNLKRMSFKDIAEIDQLRELVPGPIDGTRDINSIIADYLVGLSPAAAQRKAHNVAREWYNAYQEQQEKQDRLVAEKRWHRSLKGQNQDIDISMLGK